MDKRKMIERALLGEILMNWGEQFMPMAFIDALAEQAIVIECEVEQCAPAEANFRGIVRHGAITHSFISGYIIDYHGTPGKAIAIIVSLEEDAEDRKGF